ncbi:toxin [Campylobacter jejuni]|nr:toxin [Campylobacter jejuni]MGG42391.1 toxin [Campylobacter jejuni]
MDRGLANKIRVVFPTSATQANGGTLDYAITGNSNRQRTYTPPLLAAILMLASLRSHDSFGSFSSKF